MKSYCPMTSSMRSSETELLNNVITKRPGQSLYSFLDNHKWVKLPLGLYLTFSSAWTTGKYSL